MKAFVCRVCGNPLYVENSVCVSCGTALGYSREEREIVPVDAQGRYVDAAGFVWWVCTNLTLNGCTWLARFQASQCESCELTRTRPHDADLEGLALYQETERAKRHLLIELDSRGISYVSRQDDPETGLCFDLLSSRGEDVTIGHADGVITIDLAESNDAYREKMRIQLGEAYRTMLGHLRHEVGHYIEGLHVQGDRLEQARALFGDDTKDYQAEIDRHYSQGPPAGWEESYISEYATMHPYEDFAECFAHFLHISDTVETAYVNRFLDRGTDLTVPFSQLVVGVWIPLSIGLNQIERSMGKDDLYSFVIPAPVLDKLDFVSQLADPVAAV
ncbi:putative zinc-binding metallopeptidase [Dermatophilaceae bacterium Soc4.6]